MATSPEFRHALDYARALSVKARTVRDPILVAHFAVLAKGQFEFVRALRTGDFSKTPIRPLSHFVAAAQHKDAA